MKRALAVISLFAVAACGSPDSGMVVGKDRRAPYTWVQMICSSYNSKGICQTWMPLYHKEPECWRVYLKKDGDRWEECVSKETWDQLNVESIWTRQA